MGPTPSRRCQRSCPVDGRAWRLRRLRTVLPPLTEDLLRGVDADLQAVPDLAELTSRQIMTSCADAQQRCELCMLMRSSSTSFMVRKKERGISMVPVWSKSTVRAWLSGRSPRRRATTLPIAPLRM